MPIYEYECGGCGKRVERLVRRREDVPERCPHCGAAKLRKAFSAFSVAGGGHTEHDDSGCNSCANGSCPYSGGADDDD
jgi:putative FmdB family regulatory protein